MKKAYKFFKWKLYFLLVILAFFSGWANPRAVIVRIDDGVAHYDKGFNYGLLSLVLLIGFSVLFVMEWLLVRNEKDDSLDLPDKT